MIYRLTLENRKAKGDKMKELKINKNFEIEKLRDYVVDGLKIKYNLFTSTWGTSTMGYVYRQGLDLIQPNGEIVKAQIIFTSKGYGKITTDLKEYNKRFLPHYEKYVKDINEWLDKHIQPLITLSNL